MSAFLLLFTFCIDWIMKETIKHNRKEITWTLTKMRDDLDFVDDIALISHRHSDLQKKKTNRLANAAVKTYLKINNVKTKVMMINAKSKNPSR